MSLDKFPKLIASSDKYPDVFKTLDGWRKGGYVRSYKNMRGIVPAIHYRLLDTREQIAEPFIIAKIGINEAEWFPNEYGIKFRVPLLVPKESYHDLHEVMEGMAEDLKGRGYLDITEKTQVAIDDMSDFAKDSKSVYLLRAFSRWLSIDPEAKDVLTKYGFVWKN